MADWDFRHWATAQVGNHKITADEKGLLIEKKWDRYDYPYPRSVRIPPDDFFPMMKLLNEMLLGMVRAENKESDNA